MARSLKLEWIAYPVNKWKAETCFRRAAEPGQILMARPLITGPTVSGWNKLSSDSPETPATVCS